MPKARKSNKWVWILIFVAILAGAAYYAELPEKNKSVPEGQVTPQKYQLEKTGAGSVADFSAASKKMHTTLDNGLKNANLSVGEVKEVPREVKRQNVEGSIRWHARQLAVTVPAAMSVDKVKEALQTAVAGAGGEIFASQTDQYQGQPVVRLDIGFKDTLEGEPVTIISDKLYLLKEKTPSSATQPNVLPPQSSSISPGHGQMAIVIDDFGYARDVIETFAAINRNITFSVLPYKAHSNEAAARGLSSGHQVMLHLPMEPLSTSEEQEATSITVNMSDADIRDTVAKALQAVPGLIGVNNHQGSKATADARVMADVMKYIKANNLFFIDSRTNSRSVAGETAKQFGVRTADNHLFIDNSSNVGDIKKQLRIAAEMANRNGSVIVIGHARPNTAIAIREMIPELEAAGISLVFASQIVR